MNNTRETIFSTATASSPTPYPNTSSTPTSTNPCDPIECSVLHAAFFAVLAVDLLVAIVAIVVYCKKRKTDDSKTIHLEDDEKSYLLGDPKTSPYGTK